MGKPLDIAVLTGSLRKNAYSRNTALALAALAPAEIQLDIVDIGQLPFYNQDTEQPAPQTWAQFRERIKRADGVLFVTPEYNRSVPAVLKNAIDVGSRPYGQSAWSGKPCAVVSVSPGAVGGFGANHHLRQSLVYLDMPAMQQPEAYFGGVGKWFDDSGKLVDAPARELLGKFIVAYAAWVARFAGAGKG